MKTNSKCPTCNNNLQLYSKAGFFCQKCKKSIPRFSTYDREGIRYHTSPNGIPDIIVSIKINWKKNETDESRRKYLFELPGTEKCGIAWMEDGEVGLIFRVDDFTDEMIKELFKWGS